jgi:PAS domain S-box-containing protein
MIHNFRPDNPLENIREELQTSRQILKAIFDSTQSSIFLLAPNYRVIFFNKWARDGSKFLYGRDLFVGDSLLNYRRPGDEEIFQAFKQNFERAVISKEPVVAEREMHYPQMSFWVRSEYTPVYDDDNKLIGVLLNVQNISDRKGYETASDEMQDQLKQIAWSQSHETRQPVATILGLINIFDKETLSAENKEILLRLKDTACKLECIIQKNVLLANTHSQDHRRKKEMQTSYSPQQDSTT